MLTAKKFAASLVAIRKNDEAFRQLISDALAFAVFHARNHGQKTPFLELQAAAPGWLQKALKTVPLAKVSAKRALSEENAEHEAAFRVAEWFASHEEQKALRAASRAAKAIKTTAPIPEPTQGEENATAAQDDVIDGESETVEVSSALIVNGQVTEISRNEADMLMSALQAMRSMPLLKVA